MYITEQRLADQVRAINVNEWLPVAELSERRAEDARKNRNTRGRRGGRNSHRSVIKNLDDPMETGVSSWQKEGNSPTRKVTSQEH